jgi:hypothetical protein
MLSRIRSYECGLSSADESIDLQRDPTLLFIRSSKKLPGRLEIAHKRVNDLHLPWTLSDIDPSR